MQRIADRPWADYLDRRAARFELMEDRDRALLFRLQSLNVRPHRRNDQQRLVDWLERLRRGARYELAARATCEALFFSPDEHFLFAATNDGLGQVWDLTTGVIGSLSTGSFRGPDRRPTTFSAPGSRRAARF